MKACGIDLGTTNSCIFVVEGDANRVVADENGNVTFPSVVYAGRDGVPLVGHAARNRIGERPGPVTTIKRKMGSNETVALGTKQKTPVEISSMILSFLKAQAEKQTGEEVDRAVVTVPAYFGHIQRQQTDEAARHAGFREVTTLLEPVAAALAYSLTSEKEHLRVFVYDLGGGTFDATVLEKDDCGGLTVLSFGGDPFLGGDDLDARVVRLLIEKLKNYRLALNLENAEDFSRYQKLKFYAESAKIALTDSETVNLVRQGLFQDQTGDLVDMNIVVTRRELEDATRDLVERSIKESIATLQKNSIPLDSIDEVIMVGGMSRMPLVQSSLEAAFRRKPKLVNPDLIVAQGAALKAGQVFAERAVSASGLELDLRYDRRTDKARTRVTGVFNREVAGHTAFLLKGGDELYQQLDGVDRFVFDNVELEPGQENVFTVAVEDSAEQTVISQEITIVHNENTAPVLSSPGSVVTKPIAIWTLEGPQILFPENTPLPHTASHKFGTADQGGRIVAPIWEGNHEVERLVIEDIPTDLPLGTTILVEVTVESDYQIQASAAVPSLNRGVDIRFRIDAIDTRPITAVFVKQRMADLDAQATKAAANCASPDELEIFWIHFKGVKSVIAMELSEAEPKRLKLHEKLGELAALVRNLSQRDAEIQLTPAFDEFTSRISELLTRAIETRHSKLSEARPRIDRLQEDAQKAWKDKDRIAWTRVNNELSAIGSLLAPEMDPRERLEALAGFLLHKEMPELKAAARGRYASDIDAIQPEVLTTFVQTQSGMMTAADAANHLVTFYRTHVVPLREKLGLEDRGEPAVGGAPIAGAGFVTSSKG